MLPHWIMSFPIATVLAKFVPPSVSIPAVPQVENEKPHHIPKIPPARTTLSPQILFSITTTLRIPGLRTYSIRWPSYSLCPSLTQVNFLRANPDLIFNVDPAWFPVIFEFWFLHKMATLGGLDVCRHSRCSRAPARPQEHLRAVNLTSRPQI